MIERPPSHVFWWRKWNSLLRWRGKNLPDPSWLVRDWIKHKKAVRWARHLQWHAENIKFHGFTWKKWIVCNKSRNRDFNG